MEAIAAILVGGASTRMGRSKPAALLAGQPLIAYAIGNAREAGLTPWVIAKRETDLPPLDCRVLIEPDQPLHPLCGIVTALRGADPGPVIAVAGDMPFVTAELLAWLGSRGSTTAVAAGGHLQPLLARYEHDVLEPLERALLASESATGALEALSPQLLEGPELEAFGDPEVLCFNVNTPEDLGAAERILSRRSARPPD